MASTMVVIKGLAITAGSKPIFFANIGREDPTVFAIITVINNVLLTISDILNPTLSNNISLEKLTIARVKPLSIATLDSFQRTLKISLNSSSCNDSPRIMVTDD